MNTSAIWILGAALLVSLGYFPMTLRPPGPLRSVVKTLPILCLALASYVGSASSLVTMALLLCAGGDLALSLSGRQALLYGLAAFALAHVVYAVALLANSGGAIWDAFSQTPFAALTVVALISSMELWLIPFAALMAWPVRIYAVLIGIMFLAALTLPFGLVTIGAGLFLVSDVILAFRLFRMPKAGNWKGPAAAATWITYIAAQTLILLGITGG